MGVAYLVSAALSVFLAAYSIEYLIGVFAIAAVLEYGIGKLSGQLEKALGKVQVLRVILVFLIMGTFTFWFLLREAFSNTVHSSSLLVIAFALVVWSRILIYVSENAFWNLPPHFFDVRQSKRLYSLIDSGSFLASILAYFSVPLLTRYIAVPTLLIPSFLGTLGGLLVLQWILANYSHLFHEVPHHNHRNSDTLHKHSHAAHEHDAPLISFLKRHPYITSILTVGLFAAVANTCIDYGFLSGIELRSKNMAEIAALLGFFLGGAKLISLFLKMGMVGRLFAKFGIGKTTFVLPAGLTIVTIAGLVLSMNGTEIATIWSFTGCMLLMEFWADAVQKPALAIALQPLGTHERHRGHETMDTIIEPLALLLCAGFLLFLSNVLGLSLRGISASLLGIFLLWSIAILAFDRQYKEYLVRALKDRRLRPAEFSWNDATRAMISAKLQGSNSAEAIYALQLLPRSATKFFLDHAGELLVHNNRELKRATLEAFERFEFSHEDRERAVVQLKQAIDRETNDSMLLKEALFAVTFVQEKFDPTEWIGWLDHAQLPVRSAILAGLLKFHRTDGAAFAQPFLERMERSAIPAERAAVAEIIHRAENRDFYEAVKRLLHDTDSSVQLAAFKASARLGHPELIEPLLDRYVDRSTSSEVLRFIERSLASFGAEVFPHLMERIEGGDVEGTRLHRITRLLGTWCRIPSESGEADEVLKRQSITTLTNFLNWHSHGTPSASTPGGSLRLAALRELVASEVAVDSGTLVEDLLRDEFGRSQELLGTIKMARESRAKNIDQVERLLEGAISYELIQSTSRILLILSLRFDAQTLRKVRDTLLLGDKHHRANAYETVDHILPASIASRFVIMIEASALLHAILRNDAAHEQQEAELIGILETLPSSAVHPAREMEKRLLQNSEHFYDPWTTATIAYWFMIYNTSPSQRSSEELSMPLPFERVILLKTVDLFRETPDPILGHLAQAMEPIHVSNGERIIEKGDIGNCLYIIVEGRVRVHDGDLELSILSDRDVVGELAVLDPEPRSASVTALEETTLLRLDYDVFYDLMVDNIELARGAIAMLCRRIRNQNALVMRSRGQDRTIKQ